MLLKLYERLADISFNFGFFKTWLFFSERVRAQDFKNLKCYNQPIAYYCRQGQISKARELAGDLEWLSDIDVWEIFHYYNGYIEFIEGNYEKSADGFYKSFDIENIYCADDIWMIYFALARVAPANKKLLLEFKKKYSKDRAKIQFELNCVNFLLDEIDQETFILENVCEYCKTAIYSDTLKLFIIAEKNRLDGNFQNAKAAYEEILEKDKICLYTEIARQEIKKLPASQFTAFPS